MNCDNCNKITPNELFGFNRSNRKEYLFVCKECKNTLDIEQYLNKCNMRGY